MLPVPTKYRDWQLNGCNSPSIKAVTERLRAAVGEQPGGHIFVAEAPICDAGSPTLQGRDHLLIGVSPQTVKAHAARGLSHYIGQLYGIVAPGLIHALVAHLNGVVDLMRVAKNWKHLQTMLDEAFPRQDETIRLPLFQTDVKQTEPITEDSANEPLPLFARIESAGSGSV
jgi:hypothetical protein